MVSPRILIKNADVLVTMDDDRAEIAGGSILVEGGVVRAVGQGVTKPQDGPCEVVDATGCVVTPGLINTHHHMFQSLTRAVPGGQDALLFGWLQTLYPIWARMGPEDIHLSTQVALAELARAGCSLSSDHLYLFPNGVRLDDSIAAAGEVGVRLTATRGSMSIGQSAGGLPPDSLVEAEAQILTDSARVIDRFHGTEPGAMVQVALAPCSPFSVSRDLMRESAGLAREKGVRLHTHLAENAEDVAYSLDRFGCRPGQYAEDLGWVGSDVWHAHCVALDPGEIDLFGRTGTGVAHCPCSNGRLGSGIAPVRAMRRAGVPVGLGVDGSASNDSGDLLAEARQALLVARLAGGADAMSARTAVEIATRGGARVLGRLGELGSLEVGKRADLAIWRLDGLASAGAWDPVAALVLTGPHHVHHLMVEGRWIVSDGHLTTVDVQALAAQARGAVQRLAQG
ncbi:MAG: 8-oxoguanine deaminase [Pseudomonadota bacterium]